MTDSANPERGYVSDTPYARRFVRELSPAWLDFTALICGFAPPVHDGAFAWCELGCGHGVTPALLAATQPEARFVGIDLLAEHIDFARRLCLDAGIGNATFHAVDFGAAAALDLPQFDYIVAHGVLTWIDESAQADLARFIDRHLKPGGLVYLSYNALPGWAADMPLQHLLAELAGRAEGDSIARLAAADRIVAGMQEAGATVLREGAMGREWQALREQLPPTYFVHEFLPPGWRPRYVTEVRRQMAEIDLAPIGSATLRENVDAFTLDKPARALLASTADPDLRELMRDFFLAKRFRRDVFARPPRPLQDAEARERIAAERFMLANAPTAEGTDESPPTFQHPAARAILDLLASGPATPAGLTAGGFTLEDIVAQLIFLAAAGCIWPAGPEVDPARIDRFNAAVRSRVGGPAEIAFIAQPAGTAIEFAPEQLRAMQQGRMR